MAAQRCSVTAGGGARCHAVAYHLPKLVCFWLSCHDLLLLLLIQMVLMAELIQTRLRRRLALLGAHIDYSVVVLPRLASLVLSDTGGSVGLLVGGRRGLLVVMARGKLRLLERLLSHVDDLDLRLDRYVSLHGVSHVCLMCALLDLLSTLLGAVFQDTFNVAIVVAYLRAAERLLIPVAGGHNLILIADLLLVIAVLLVLHNFFQVIDLLRPILQLELYLILDFGTFRIV